MSNFKRAPPNTRNSLAPKPKSTALIGALHAASLTSLPVGEKTALPAEILAVVLNFLDVPTLLACARCSRRMQEMVYDDTRWVQRLQSMGVWNETEARKRVEEGMKRRMEAQTLAHGANRHAGAATSQRVNGYPGASLNGPTSPRKTSVTLFDQGLEEERQQNLLRNAQNLAMRPRQGTIDAGFDAPVVLPTHNTETTPVYRSDAGAALKILSRVRSIRGAARQEYGKVYAALSPLYFDLVRSRTHADPILFRTFREPDHQAQMLSQLRKFAESDYSQGCGGREEKLDSMIGVFENAVLREFEQGMQVRDVDGKMKRYAHVLVVLNGGAAGVDTFIQNNPAITEKDSFGSPLHCLDYNVHGGLTLEPARQFFDRLSEIVNEQISVIDRVFPPATNVLMPFLERITEDVIAEYVTSLAEESHDRNVDLYLRATSGAFQHALRYVRSLELGRSATEAMYKQVEQIVARAFEQHVDLYLQEEMDNFKQASEAQVDRWEKQISDEQASKESFFMSNVNRQADKRDFLTSFRKVIMMPVNAVAAVPSAFTTSSSAKPVAGAINGDTLHHNHASHPSTPIPGERTASPMPGSEAPTTELAAKAAIMNSRLEGIRSLFSIEIALNLIHSAKSSLERVALFVRLGGQSGEEAREQCEAVFVTLLQILGERHIKSGFDRAVGHLGTYNPREISEHSTAGVEPLVTFLELVNVGDLIQQMLDVFYAQELVATRLAERDEFTSPAVKQKRRFESMLDERVAAGLNKGIDVLMDEVEYLFATLQQPIDFNPGATKGSKHTPEAQVIDLEPTEAAKRIVKLVSSHVGMLEGSTEKNMLDVFNQEVGLRLFAAICKHIKRQRISVEGAIRLISDTNTYHAYITTMRNKPLTAYFSALRELAQIYLIDAKHAREIGTIIADQDRYKGIFRAEEVYEFAERRADWFVVKKDVERAMYGMGCVVM